MCIYYIFVFYVLNHKKEKKLDNVEINTNFVNNSTLENENFSSVFPEMEEEFQSNKLLEGFKSSNVEGTKKINPLTHKKDETFKIIRNEKNSGNKDNT